MADDGDLLYGVPAIAEHLGLRERVVYHLIQKGHMPTFKIGDRVCARRTSLAQWLADREAAAKMVSEGGAVVGGDDA